MILKAGVAPLSVLRSLASPDSSPAVRAERVFLRAPRLGDFEAWAELRRESRAFLTPWEPTWPADDLTRPAFRRRLRRYADERRQDLAYPFFVFRTADEALVGGLTLSNVRRGVAQTCTLGYWMGQRHAGQGYMSAAVRAVLPHAFSHLRLRRVEAACLPHNEPSIRLLERTGFRREGLAREYLCIDGVWQDHLLFAVLKKDVEGG